MHVLTLHILALQVALTAPPPDARTELERGQRLYETGQDMKGARAALDEAIRLDPSLPHAYLYRALVTMETGKLADAEADFKKALALAPEDATVRRFYGEELAEAGQYDAAEEHYKKALALEPENADVIYLYGRLLRDRGQLEAAIAKFEEHARILPTGTSHHALGEIFLRKGDLERAAKEFELDLATDETCYESRVNLAGLALEQEQWATARDHYRKSLEFHPADARALSGLGMAYLELGDYELAVGTLRHAEDLAPLDQDVKDALGQARWKLRWRLSWPFAGAAGLFAVGLAAVLVAWRRKR
jgi:Tfp pilus assembly protein PilF